MLLFFYVLLMRTFLRLLLPLLFIFTSCRARHVPSPGSPGLQGQRLYTQQTFQYEKGRYRTTNYRKGTLVPVNTLVEVLEVGSGSAVLLLPDGERVVVENIEKHTGASLEEVLRKMLSNTKVDLTPFSSLERKHIGAGTVAPGMSKRAVVVAIGYPPKHETPTSKMNSWRYWSSKFNTFVVNFENDKVKSVQD